MHFLVGNQRWLHMNCTKQRWMCCWSANSWDRPTMPLQLTCKQIFLRNYRWRRLIWFVQWWSDFIRSVSEIRIEKRGAPWNKSISIGTPLTYVDNEKYVLQVKIKIWLIQLQRLRSIVPLAVVETISNVTGLVWVSFAFVFSSRHRFIYSRRSPPHKYSWPDTISYAMAAQNPSIKNVSPVSKTRSSTRLHATLLCWHALCVCVYFRQLDNCISVVFYSLFTYFASTRSCLRNDSSIFKIEINRNEWSEKTHTKIWTNDK